MAKWSVSWRAATIISTKEAMDSAIHAEARRAGLPAALVAEIASKGPV